MAYQLLSKVARDAAVCQRIAALVAIVMLAALALPSTAVRAQNATWRTSPSNGDFNNSANWSPTTVPTGIASFGTSTITNLFLSNDVSINGWTFNAGASSYTVYNSWSISFNGSGISVTGGSVNITNDSHLGFFNTSSAGSATIANNGSLIFFNGSESKSVGKLKCTH